MSLLRRLADRLRSGRRRLLLVGAGACLAGALVLWTLAFSSSEESTKPASSSGAPGNEGARLTYAADDDVSREAKRPPRDRPRSRLPEGHEPAFGNAVARVRIAAIGVDAPVIRLGLNPDRTLQVPGEASKAGWWSGGARPGRPGAAVIVGHVDSRSGPAVFYRLGELSTGDRVEVLYPDGSEADFLVTAQRQASKNRFPTRAVYGDTTGASLRLVTCSGSFDSARGHYRSNLIVFARQA